MLNPRYQRQPTLEILSQSELEIKFVLRNCDVSLANSLRRIMIAEVPTLAIDLVTMEENTSVHQDEMIAHRLGLLPIDSRNIRQYVNKADCTCIDNCSRCSVSYTLDVQCTTGTGGQANKYVVTHLDLVPYGPQAPMPVPSEHEIQPLRPKWTTQQMGIVIAKLRDNQRIKAELTAIKGMGKIHGKWNPTSTAVFQYEPDIRIDEKMQKSIPLEVKRDIVKNCPKQVFQLKAVSEVKESGTDDLETDFFMFGNENEGNADTAVQDLDLEVADASKCIFCKECEQICAQNEARGFVQVRFMTDRFYFTVQSTGAMPAVQIVMIALEVLEEKLTHVTEQLVAIPSVSAALGLGVGGPGQAGFGVGALDLS